LADPNDAPSLASGGINGVTLSADGPTSHDADCVEVNVLSAARLAELEEIKAGIAGMPVDPVARAYMLAQAYQQQELYADSIELIGEIAREQAAPSAQLDLELGGLYWAVELEALARKSFQRALEIARASSDVGAQADACLGLARVSAALGELSRAVQHYDAAEAHYREVGDIERAVKTSSERAELA
jgi:tetratricopeptide (TPR) repeat protein